MFDGKNSKVLTIILVIVIVAIVGVLGFITFDYIRKYSQTKQASEFVDNYQGEVQSNDKGNNTTENSEFDFDVNEVAITSSNETAGALKKKYKGFTVCRNNENTSNKS